MRIAITGAAGFVGSVLWARAQAAGHEVVGVDDLSRGLNPVYDLPGLFVKWDCRAGLPMEARQADVVVHFAAATGSLDRPIEELRDLNVAMTKAVYGTKRPDALFFWPTTSLALAVPESPYVQSKEEAFAWVREQENAVPLRFFNQTGAYGVFTERRKKEVHILPILAESIVTGKPFVINGWDYDTVDGTPSRDFTSVVDTADYILWMTEHQAKKAPDGAVWCGTGHAATVGQLILWAQMLFPRPIRVEEGPRRVFDTGMIRCSFAQAYQMYQALGRRTGWQDSVKQELSVLISLMEATHGVAARSAV